ncbi:MAG: rod-binding protein [Cyanobacteria bacterium]|nr:rod-binding protein [Cyanobacteriota bacterium]
MDGLNCNLPNTTSLNLTQLKQLGESATHSSQSADKAKMKKTAQEFEAIFIQQLVDAMDKTVQHDGMFSGGPAEESFRGMLNQQIALQMSQRAGGSGLGLAETVYKQMEQSAKAQKLDS